VKIPLPNLDDRRWSDLVDEGRSLIPLYAPDWTDHNVHDPGITLMELLAWIAEMDIYQLNRISDRHKLKFLSLVGITPKPPQAARTVLSFVLKAGIAPLPLQAGTQFAGVDPFGEHTPFRLRDPITVVPGKLQAIQVKDAAGFHDVTERWRREEPFGVFGAIPETGTELYLGFTEPLPAGVPLSVYFQFVGEQWSDNERQRILEEMRDRRQSCRPPENPCAKPTPRPMAQESSGVKLQCRTRISWFYLSESTGDEKWLTLDPKREDIVDDTCAFGLGGRVVLKTRGPMRKKALGENADQLFYFRCRFEAGAYDSPPIIRSLIVNAAAAEQAVPVQEKFIIVAAAPTSGDEPVVGKTSILRMAASLFPDPGEKERKITSIIIDNHDPVDLGLGVLAYKKATMTTAGSLTIEGCMVGMGTGAPHQKMMLPVFPVQQSSFRLFSLENNQNLAASQWHSWQRQEDFVASQRTDFHYLLDPTNGEITFGDGENAHVPPPGALIFAAYNTTRAGDGNLGIRSVMELRDSAHNRVAVQNFNAVKASLEKITNAIDAAGGLFAETLESATARAIELMDDSKRAVTLKDYEKLALNTPGAKVGRASAKANLHAGFPCLKASGVITVVILPNMPVKKPVPSRGLLRTVASYLDRRRIIGTRVEVVGPTYLDVTVRAKVRSVKNASKTNLTVKIVKALDDFFDPLTGGPEQTGWPFGRDVYRSEVLQVIDEVIGVDHVIDLELSAEGCEPQCGNICLAPDWLVSAGEHVIEVL
jgi:hypothetical protein